MHIILTYISNKEIICRLDDVCILQLCY